AKYELQYSKNSEMQNATNLEMNSNKKLVGGLESGKTYYWRVRSINENGDVSAYSSVEKFTPVSAVTGIEDQKEIPTEFKLEQNFPNPFNPTTTLSFSIPVEGFYNLDIFNILGEKVASLQNGFLNPGVFKSTFDAKNLSSGVYFYKLNGNNVNLVRKMMLIK
ncbi:MAG: T9SS type A sorting domain-containing protein, partial [Ignavibacteria bacterium]|nr:T9SS type A sorting domain-containing protein [Ignavibacteria bacterium]